MIIRAEGAILVDPYSVFTGHEAEYIADEGCIRVVPGLSGARPDVLCGSENERDIDAGSAAFIKAGQWQGDFRERQRSLPQPRQASAAPPRSPCRGGADRNRDGRRYGRSRVLERAAGIEIARLDVLDAAQCEAIGTRWPPSISSPTSPVTSITARCSMFARGLGASFDLNVNSMYRTIRSVLPRMLELGGGRDRQRVVDCLEREGHSDIAASTARPRPR